MSDEVRLRSIDPNDLPIFYEQQLDADAIRMAAFPSRDRAAFDAHWATNILGNLATFTQTILIDGKVAGNIVSWPQEGGVRLVGYWIGKQHCRDPGDRRFPGTRDGASPPRARGQA